jgi:hypothetical protein
MAVATSPGGALNGSIQPRRMSVGTPTRSSGYVEWGDTFWPSPVFLPEGPGSALGEDGLLELKVELPTTIEASSRVRYAKGAGGHAEKLNQSVGDWRDVRLPLETASHRSPGLRASERFAGPIAPPQWIRGHGLPETGRAGAERSEVVISSEDAQALGRLNRLIESRT